MIWWFFWVVGGKEILNFFFWVSKPGVEYKASLLITRLVLSCWWLG